MKSLSRRGIQIALGILWLLDGCLQLQHQMFTKNFASQVLTPAAQGQPSFVSGPIHWGVHVFLTQPAVFNALFAIIQLAIGIFILFKPTVKIGLSLSVAWGLIVWIFGEGYGGIFSGHTLILMGAPGGVILYVLIALAVMPKANHDNRQIAYWLAVVWAILWVGGGIYQLMPGQNTTSSYSAMLSANASGAPKWLATLDNDSAKFVSNFGPTTTHRETAAEMHMTSQQMAGMTTSTPVVTTTSPGYIFIIAMAALQFFVGIGVLMSGARRKTAIWVGIVLSLIFWVVGQNLGEYYSGLATDPSSGPLYVLMGLAILGSANLDKNILGLNRKIQHLVIGKATSS